MPAIGCVRPHHSWPTPNARLMLARPRPVVVLMTLRNRPIDWRAPIVTAKTPPAASRTRPKATGARERGAAADRIRHRWSPARVSDKVARQSSSSACSSATRAVAEPLVEGELGPLPFALRLERAWRGRAAVSATRRERPSSPAPISAQPLATSGCRLRVSVEASIAIAAARSLGRIGPRRSMCESSEYCVVFRPRGGDDPVIVLADAARQLAQLEVRAALRRARR